MPRHPFELLPLGVVRRSAVGLLLAWLLLTGLLAGAVPVEYGRQMIGFLHAADARAAAAMVAAWSPDVRSTAAFTIGFDFLYDLVHDNAVALLCVWAAQVLGARRFTSVARVLAWTMWLNVLLNLPENLAALHIIRTGDAAGWFDLVVAITSFRFATLWIGVAVGGGALLAAHRRVS